MVQDKLQSLTQIFTESLFRIPDFQRGYSWNEKQLEDFWEDIANLKSDKIHYTGLLTVEPINKKDIIGVERWQDDVWVIESGLSAYYVIDGQQRLTTSIIFIDQLLRKFNKDEGLLSNPKEYWASKFLYKKQFNTDYKSFIFGYEKDNPSDEFFKTKILDQESSSADKVPEQTLYTSNLSFAKNFFFEKLKDIGKDELEELFKKVTQRLKFNFYEIDNELDVHVTFETMNNRGKPLSNLELLKNRLIYLTTVLNDNQDTRNRLRKDINETWKTIYEYLGKNKDNPLDDDDFLRNHWIMYFTYDRKESAAYAKFLLNKKFTAKSVINGELQLSDIKAYIDSLGKSVKSWYYLYNPSSSSFNGETKEWIQKLNRLGMSAFPPLFMAALTKSQEGDLVELFKSAERFVFLVFRLSQRPSNTKNSHFYRLANYFYTNNHDINSVIEDIKRNTDGEEGEGEDYHYHGWFEFDKFQRYISEQFEKEDGYYTWSGLRYFLYEYELHLQDNANGNQKVNWVDFNKRKKENTIEHIYPQTPKDKCWKESFSGYSIKQQKRLLHSIGNLVLLSQSKNSELQNKCFNFKKRHTNISGNDVGYFNGSYSEIEVSAYDDWTPVEIMERGAKILNFLSERWGIDFESWGVTNAHLLQLDFVEHERTKKTT